MTATARTNTPDRINDGSTTIRLKRACNGCGQYLGDADNRDVDECGNLTDVRSECPDCWPLVELEAAGCDVRQLTERSIGGLWRWIDNGKPFYVDDPTNTKGRADGTPRGLKVDGLSVFNVEATDYADRRHVARFGDWIIRHPDGRWSVHKAPASARPA
ncbi:hypothetical protein ACFC09_36240 [Streptomyces sp. NPDC056161]|uniref:hypothetical protein n=1 Tax=Streptomyces sp. NPDC056161 TaxID=3345732 RepID=UPI0035D71909